MKRGSTIFLKVVLILIGIIVLAICIFALPSGIRSNDAGMILYRPIFYGLYLPTIPAFLALFQTWKLLTYIDTNKAFSDLSVDALKKIKYCAFVTTFLLLSALPFIFKVADEDDAPGLILIWTAFSFTPLIVSTFAAVLQRILQDAIYLKSENDLTV